MSNFEISILLRHRHALGQVRPVINKNTVYPLSHNSNAMSFMKAYSIHRICSKFESRCPNDLTMKGDGGTPSLTKHMTI